MFDFLSRKFSDTFKYLTGQNKITEKNAEAALDQVKDALLEADVPYKVVEDFTAQVKEEVLGKKVYSSLKPEEQLTKVIYDKILNFLGGKELPKSFSFSIPSTVMLMGLQGAGKTTTIAKIANYVRGQAKKRNKSRKVLLASVDFCRPAAIDQLEILAKQTGCLFYRANSQDPISAAKEIVNYAKKEQVDITLLDTAGRLHVDNEMLFELQQIDSIVNPKYKILVADAMTGQESLRVAQAFNEQVGFDGAIVTKMDSEARGGLVFAFRYSLDKPILFIATGEKVDDLQVFHPERIASRIIGMGDVKTLIEKAEEKIKKSEQDSMYKSFEKGKMTLDDFAKQISMVNRLGSLSQIMKFLPGANSLPISSEMLQKGEVEIKKFKAIISSMTSKEKQNYKIIDASRKNRIAKGSGVEVSEVDTLLSRFKQSQQMLKAFKNFGGFRSFGK